MEEIAIRGVPTRVWKHGHKTLVQLAAGMEAFADREFVVFENERITYGAFLGASRTLAARLAGEGVGKGQVVAIALPNRPEWLVAFFAVAMTGATAALL